ncbi:class I SAM-dependent methyltransferase [Paraburkholderia graminis]|uniref:class I SAM-dependent methyltransferase n=1 Tax=Paraburkholderia graminis TaxID=60548 RepID=UPI0038BD6969
MESATDGVLVSHGIMAAGPASSEFGLDGGGFSGGYVFPGDELPDLGYALTAMRGGGLEVSDIQNLRRHCARTLRLWEQNFRMKSMALRQQVDDRSFQTWCDYLSSWAVAFEHDHVAIYEIVGRKVGTRANALPWPGPADRSTSGVSAFSHPPLTCALQPATCTSPNNRC